MGITDPDGHCSQASTEATTVFSLEQNFSATIIHPIINGLLLNHLVDSEGDLPAVKRFKHIVTEELKRRFAPSCLDTAKSLPVLCLAVDPRYAHLQFLSKQQREREIACEELLGQMESLETEGDKEGTDSTETAGPPNKKSKSSENSDRPPSKKSKSSEKASAMQFFIGTLSEKESVGTSSDELEHIQKEPALDPDSNVLDWWKNNAERFPSISRLARQLLCIPASSVPSERVFSVSGNIVTKKRANLKPDNVNMLVFLNKNLPPLTS